ncbi:hypothetical protein [Bacillus phage vB_Bpu_PumA1]|uniref:Uncharacterized protein n=1 Tax=Bacillus phage vB_Bpu_PumA1 TaxID=2662127 RepID=A0A5Q2WB69_9CAUD|nr:hypothetical protein H3020_gp06 [Bacillus phage vB_Bpu_PumA1]QGH74199.1 hypothetical protein [Bacillus phage vB_Bpu_PumA1]
MRKYYLNITYEAVKWNLNNLDEIKRHVMTCAKNVQVNGSADLVITLKDGRPFICPYGVMVLVSSDNNLLIMRESIFKNLYKEKSELT